jgi:hypothetical protein
VLSPDPDLTAPIDLEQLVIILLPTLNEIVRLYLLKRIACLQKSEAGCGIRTSTLADKSSDRVCFTPTAFMPHLPTLPASDRPA